MDIDRRIRVLDDRERDDGSVTHISDLRDRPFVVLLGEPGIGKSTVLGAEAVRENLAVVTVRELMTGTEIPHGTPLYLDALDEYRTDGGAEDKAHTFANAILKHGPPRWRLTCRSEDWRKSADIAPIRKTTSGQPITVAQLLPLDTDEAVAILRSWGEPDPAKFVRSAGSFGATAFLENPLGLKLLRKAVADGGAWPANRFELFASAVRKLSYEHSDVRVVTERHDPDTILNAAAEACLVLLVAGARAVWRSNREPPALGDARAFVTWHELGMDRSLLDDVLDTALFRGEGESFEPMHKTVAEFLAAGALSAAVRGTRTRAALPLSRALALVTAEDGTAPTELRGLYAWFAAHLARDGARRRRPADPEGRGIGIELRRCRHFRHGGPTRHPGEPRHIGSLFPRVRHRGHCGGRTRRRRLGGRLRCGPEGPIGRLAPALHGLRSFDGRAARALAHAAPAIHRSRSGKSGNVPAQSSGSSIERM